MNQEYLFAQAIGLPEPWYIEKVEFIRGDSESMLIGGQLDIHINFKSGWKFLGSDQNMCPVHDTVERSWRHINFFQHTCYLYGRIPRIKLMDGSVATVQVPWAKAGSGFTLLFEAISLLYIKEGMSLSGAGRVLNEDGRTLGRIVDRYVTEAKASQDIEDIQVIGIDEVSFKKSHKYFTIISDCKRKKVVGIGIGKGKAAVNQALNEMDGRNCNLDAIEYATIDLSPSFIAAILTFLPEVRIIYDRFHVEALLSKAVDTVRKQEQAIASELKNTKYLWLKNVENLTKKQKKKIHYLGKCFPTVGTAYQLKQQFKQIYNNNNPIEALKDLKEWITLAMASKIAPIIHFVNTLQSHWSGIVSYFEKQYTNAFAEQINSTIQFIKRIAKGYRNTDNFITMIYFKLGGLKFDFFTH